MKRNNAGFTLLELIIIVAVAEVIAAIVSPIIREYQANKNNSAVSTFATNEIVLETSRVRTMGNFTFIPIMQPCDDTSLDPYTLTLNAVSAFAGAHQDIEVLGFFSAMRYGNPSCFLAGIYITHRPRAATTRACPASLPTEPHR